MMKYSADGRKTIKGFLLTAMNFNLDKIMSSVERIESFPARHPIQTYHERTFISDFGHRPKIPDNGDEVEVFERTNTKMPSMCIAKSPTVILRKKGSTPDARTFVDIYEDDF
jgi:hypothetical protein